MTDPSPSAGRALLICSSGGHLAQLVALRPWYAGRARTWVTFDTPHARSILDGEHIEWAYHPTTRDIPNLIRNTGLALRLLLPRRTRPEVLVSTGAGVAFPFFVLGRLLRVPTVYIEVYDRIDMPTLTARLCRPFTSLFLVQWPEQREMYPEAVVVGHLL